MMNDVVVTQADRDAAADFRKAYSGADGTAVALYRNGSRDRSTAVQAFARHRTNAVEPLIEALDATWLHAKKMRDSSKLVGPYPNDRDKHRVWQRSLYHEGKALMELLKPARTLLASYRGEQL